MMKKLTTLDKNRFAQVYHTTLTEAFPPEERKPLRLMEAARDAGCYLPMAMCGEGGEEAYVCLWTDMPYVLIDYLWVPAALRNRGLGREILQLVFAAFPSDTVFLGEVESPVGEPRRDALILRRLAFYARSAAVTLNYDVALFGVHYKVLAWGKQPFDTDEIMRRHRRLYEQSMAPEQYRAAIRIPLPPGETPRAFREWFA